MRVLRPPSTLLIEDDVSTFSQHPPSTPPTPAATSQTSQRDASLPDSIFLSI